MKQIQLESNIRSDVGKGYCRRLRVKGLMPGVLYGGGKKSIPVELKSADLIHILREGGENVLINFTLPDLPQETVILKEKQTHPYKRSLLHADFCRISLKEKLTVTAPIELIGTAKGVKEGGILEQVMWDVEINALPTHIPESIKVDVTNLEIGTTIHIKDLIVEKEVEIKHDPEAVVLHIALQREEKVAEVVPAEGADEPEVIREKKKVEEEE